jgi:tetratricopeptide (TPR) repeat protein
MSDHNKRRPHRGQAKRRPDSPRLQHGAREPRSDPIHLSDDTVRELKATARPGKGDILVKVFADAMAAFAEEDYGEAIRLGEQAKHIALRSIAARELLGLAYYRAGHWSEAARELSAFRRLTGSTEQNPVIADCYRAMRKPDKAIEYCDEVKPGRVDEGVYYEAQIVAAGALADMRRMDEAIARLEALDLSPKVAQPHHLRAWYALADLLERRGRYTQARELFEAVAAADSDLTDAPVRARRLAAR